MIDPIDIVRHLRSFLPVHTDRFTESFVASGTSLGNTITVSSVSHGLSVGQKVVIAGAKFQNFIVSVTDNGDNTVTMTTQFDHDQTRPRAPNDPKTLEISGFPESVWNGNFDIIDVVNRRNFKINKQDVSTPTIGSGFLNEQLANVIGVQTVDSVIDPDNFTLLVSGPPLPTGDVQDLNVIKDLRIYGAADFQRARNSFTSDTDQQKASLYVMMLDTDTSKDRHALNDAVSVSTRSSSGKLTLLQRFATMVFIPTQDDKTGFNAQNDAYGEIFRALMSTLYGFRFVDQTGNDIKSYLTVPVSNGSLEYNPAFYAHGYDWELPTVITFNDNGFNSKNDVAFRDISLDFSLNGDDLAVLSSEINLDKEPLN